jgi:hypothetical protein
MKRDGKYRFGSGQGRSNRYRDRAQLTFNDMLVDEYITGEDEFGQHERQTLPVRFGAGRLADHLSDSTIATAIVPEGDPVADLTEAAQMPVPIHLDLPDPLFAAAPAEQPPAIMPARRRSRSPATARPTAFSVWNLAKGFFIGAGGTVAAMILLRVLR